MAGHPSVNLRKVSSGGSDHYPTPAWAVRGLLSYETFDGTVNEPCCGRGNVSTALATAGYAVVSSDIYDYGYGMSGVDARTIPGPIDNIITNPPYNLAAEMLTHFLQVTTGKVALLLRLSFLESKRRYPLFRDSPLKAVYVFSERLSLAPDGQQVQGGGTVSYGWYVWEASHVGPPTLHWIEPGHKIAGML